VEHALAESVDRHLCEQNLEYESKRNSFRLRPVTLSIMPRGTWERFAQDRLARQGGNCEQYKHPCLSPDLEFRHRFPLLRETNPNPGMNRKLA
jgi:GH3 auxin-responsive promoter